MKALRVRKIMVMSVIAVAVGFLGVADGYANRDKGGYSKGGMQGGGHYEMPLHAKLFMKAKFLMIHQEELGLSEQQLDAIKDIKHGFKKEMITRTAEIEVIKVDIKALLHKRVVDVEAINRLIDQKYAIKNAKSKSMVQAFADLKAVLTDAQYDQMKKIWLDMKKKHHGK